jgi:hypothetical protein
MSARIYFRVSRKQCSARDETGFEYQLPKSLAHLNVGDRFSVPASEAPTDNQLAHSANLCVESGDYSELKLSGERKRFESEGQQSAAGWPVRVGNSSYSSGTPDSGRFSHPQDPVKR